MGVDERPLSPDHWRNPDVFSSAAASNGPVIASHPLPVNWLHQHGLHGSAKDLFAKVKVNGISPTNFIHDCYTRCFVSDGQNFEYKLRDVYLRMITAVIVKLQVVFTLGVIRE